MIKKLKIHAYKSIKDLTISCSNLNLFVGTNSSGKSTCLQALLLFEQNRRTDVGLNGEQLYLGEFREIRNNYMPRENIRIELEGTDEAGQETSESLEFAEADESYEVIHSGKKADEYKKFYYLSCHRIGAMIVYERNFQQYTTFGHDGEYALDYLLQHGEDPVDEMLKMGEDQVSGDLMSQVNCWLKYIIGTELSLRKIQKTNYLQVTYNNNPANSSSYALYCTPFNVGSGVSYLISIIIACLGSENDSVILVENPEIHLHPKAQSRLSELLYLTAKSGRQLFVETHSDHIFNGIRVGISSGNWDPALVSVNFLAMNQQCETMCNPIEFGPLGKIYGRNPEMDLNDLFDQFEIDLDRMLGLD